MRELPPVVPLFPLPDVVLFPRVLLPLHLFEPRYRALARDALAGEHLIGMVLLRGDWRADYYGRPDVFETGTVGQIVDHARLPDGRYNIVLAGVREFRIEEEFADRPYRYARVAWRSPEGSTLRAGSRDDLLALAYTDLQRRGRTGNVVLPALAEADDEKLVNALSQALDFTAVERLWLLEAVGIEARADRLRELLEIRVEANAGGGSHPGGGGFAH